MEDKNLGLSKQEFEQLVAQASPFSEAIFEKLYKKIFDANYKYLENWLRKEVGNHNSIDIEDCVQEGFIRFSEAIEKKALIYGNLLAWLKVVIKNIWIKEKQYRQKISIDNSFAIEESSESTISLEYAELSELQCKAYQSAYDTMPFILKTVFNLHIIQCVEHKKIANELNISEESSRDRMRRAKSYLKEKIQAFINSYLVLYFLFVII